MHLKNLLLLASAAMGAIAQYDNGLYNDVQYDDVPYDIFADDSGPRPKAIVFEKRHCKGRQLVSIWDDRCRNLAPHM
ncbi:hypothetical protein MAA_07571 [Metarhizium robertsii ARSEF 23]|uniref:Uncharacterized protein n=1 Tax=Metarhizium robertsii (strain ARSEF 23 / ATCC MYA-3075) TaxID=655844 RepID=E9F5M2_METRA|nr:uncharacterized protein MAA_07571 [Metarhizium robertsii ARSEF 23]EFY97025.2 hypothetical protein MAA_07571 [Metarhizium robertsii ARSEF 23]